jgi:hypothetical protein
LKGDAAVKYSNANNIVENNRPYVTNFVVSADNITVGEPAIIIATVDEDATGTVHFIVTVKLMMLKSAKVKLKSLSRI